MVPIGRELKPQICNKKMMYPKQGKQESAQSFKMPSLVSPCVEVNRAEYAHLNAAFRKSLETKKDNIVKFGGVAFGAEELSRLTCKSREGSRVTGVQAYLNDEIMNSYSTILQNRHEKLGGRYRGGGCAVFAFLRG